MSGLIGLFVTPAGRPEAVHAAPVPEVVSGAAPAVVVLGGRRTAAPVASLLAAGLRGRTRAGCALVGDWRGDAPAPARAGAASRSARAVGERLGGRGLEPAVRGRLVTVALSADPAAAAAEWGRAVAASAVPAVCALGGPRPGAFAPWIEEADLVVVVVEAAAPPELAALARAGLEAMRAPVVVTPPVSSLAARLLPGSSVATSRALGADVAAAVRALA